MSQYLGDISAYALAVSQGYTGTEEEYAELMASYATVGQTAVTAAQTATTKASEAATSATTATNKASEAASSATTATTAAEAAQADADAAALDASQAMSAASTATTKATEATTAAATAVSAKDDAVAANTAAQSAKTAAQTAQTGAETAAASVQSSAEQIQTNADDISELKEDLSEIVTSEEITVTDTILKTTEGMELKDSYAISYDGSISPQASYYTYIYQISHTGELYFAEPSTNSTLLMFAVYTGYPTSETWKGTRYKSSDNNLPKASNKLSVNVGDYIAISYYLSASASSLYFTLYEDYQTTGGYTFGDISLNNNQLIQSNLKQKIFIKYVSGLGADASTEKVEVYQPTSVGFIRYDVLHSVDVAKNCDIWRLGYAYYVDENFENAVAITILGEWECALHLDNAGDYTGGYVHGNETLNNAVFFVNGIVADITEYTDITQITSLIILTSSNMYDSTDTETLIATRGCARCFTAEGLTVKQSVKWAVNTNTLYCYLAMNLPAKSYVNKFYMNTDLEPKDISFSMFPGVTDVTLYKDGGITNNFSISEYPTGLTGGDRLLTADNGGNPYVKCYYVVTSGTVVTDSTVWKSNAFYRFDK